MLSSMSVSSGWHGDDRSRLFWSLQAIGWMAAALLTIGIGSLVYSSLGSGLVAGTARSLFGFAATSFILRVLVRRIRRRGLMRSPSLLLGVALLCGVLGLVSSYLVEAILGFLPISLEQPGVRPFLAASTLLSATLYGVWCVLYFVVHYWLDTQRDQLRVARAETMARSSELQLLRAQVNPHFLFNALNSLLGESTNASSVRALTLALAEYLRFSLAQHQDEELLGVELAALENYLRVEKFRFEDDLEYTFATDDEAAQTLAPVSLVQPLVENAIKYGQQSPVRPLRVTVTSRVADGNLIVEVGNTGQWIDGAGSTQLGLANLRRRLELLYGNHARLDVDASDGEVRVRVTLPTERDRSRQ